MGDYLKKVKSGDSMVISASTFNTFIDAARAHKARRQAGGGGGEGIRCFMRTEAVQVKNDSGADVGRFGVLGIDCPVIGPDDNLVEFQGRLTLNCVTPIAGTHDGRFVVLLEPIGSGRIGRACASGMIVAKVNVSDYGHGCADVDDGDTTHLKSCTSGAATILWMESGTGEKWAVVRIGSAASGGSAAALLVKVVSGGGVSTWSTYVVQPITIPDEGDDGPPINGVCVRDEGNAIPAGTLLGPLLEAASGTKYVWPFAVLR